MPLFRIDLHAHCDCDPIDILTFSPFEVIDQAVESGLHALAITPHMIPFHDEEAFLYAKKRGLLLIPGVEKLVSGKEILLINVTPAEIPSPCTFEDLRSLRRTKGDQLLIIAPHPFYPHPKCSGPILDEISDLIDAVEYSHFHFFRWNPNKKTVDWAKHNLKPVLANSDAHRIEMIGRNYTIVDAEELSISAIFHAIRTGKISFHAPALNLEHVVVFTLGVIGVQEIAHRVFTKIHPRDEK